jgi:predicted dehydrogenase
MHDRREFIQRGLFALAASANFSAFAGGQRTSAEKRIGLIGLDTSHSPAFTKIINDPSGDMKDFRVSHAYPYGSKTIESSASRIPQYTKEMMALGITITDTLEQLVASVDLVMLMTNDGTVHYQQIMPVLRAGKPVFVDKPVAAGLKDVIRIYDAVNEHKVPMFSSSPLRFIEGAQKVRYEGIVGDVIGAEAFSPQKTEPSHTDLYWYGIHGVEILFTMMGMGCVEVSRRIEKYQDIVTGRWADGRIGTYRGDLEGRQHYGGIAYGTKGTHAAGPFGGYGPLVKSVAQFFRDFKPPVEAKETLELYTFMEAADESKRNGGDWVKLQQVFDSAAKSARK